MTKAEEFLRWQKDHVVFDDGLSLQDKESWQSAFSHWANSFKGVVFPEGKLLIKGALPSEDFVFWLKRAVKREQAQAAVYDSVKDRLVERPYFWKSAKAADSNELALLPFTPPAQKRALFLDRDGIINEDGGYIHQKEEVRFVDGIEKVISFANQRDILVVVLTNQSGVGREYYSENDVISLHEWMGEELKKRGAHIDAWYYSPYHPEATQERYQRASYTRKPLPGMAIMAAQDHGIALEHSVMIGDKVSDILAHVDMATLLLRGNYPLGNYRGVFENHQEILDELSRLFR